MNEKSVAREAEKCREILQGRKTKDIEKLAVTAYLKSLQEDAYDIRH